MQAMAKGAAVEAAGPSASAAGSGADTPHIFEAELDMLAQHDPTAIGLPRSSRIASEDGDADDLSDGGSSAVSGLSELRSVAAGARSKSRGRRKGVNVSVERSVELNL